MRLALYGFGLLLLLALAWLLTKRSAPVSAVFQGQVGSNITLPGITTTYNRIYER